MDFWRSPAGLFLIRIKSRLFRIRRSAPLCSLNPLIVILVFSSTLSIQAAVPSISAIETNSTRVPKFALFEATFQVAADPDNPFNPGEIDVYALIHEPGGTDMRVPAFFAQDFRRSRQGENETLNPVGKPEWKIRFTPKKAGMYRFELNAQSKQGYFSSDTMAFECFESERSGFVRVAPNARNFQCDDGSPFFAIGMNTCWGKDTADYEHWLVRMAENGINTGRLWIGPMFLFAPEPKNGLGRFDQSAAWRLDYVLQLAERYNIRLMLCLESFNSLRSKPEYAEWQNSPYNAANGGPCAKPEEFFTAPAARELFKRRLHYLVARWSYSPSVLAWELWNEVDLVDDYAAEPVRIWHAEMANVLKTLDPNQHMITTSFSKTEGEAQIDALPPMSFVQTHSYTAQDLATDFSAYAAKQKQFGKPHLLGEFGLHWEGKGNTADPEGLHLRETIWSTALSGSAGCGMTWWWDSYIDPKNLWPMYRPLSAFCADVPWNRRDWQPLQATAALAGNAAGVPQDLFLKGVDPAWNAHPSNRPQRVTVAADGSMAGHETVAGILHGKGNHPDLHNPITFNVDSPQGWKFNLVVKGVSGHGGANLEIKIDGVSKLKEDFRDDDPLNDETITKYDKTYSVEVPAGEHSISAVNTGVDWLFCSYELRGVGASRTPPLKLFGQQSGDFAVCWVQNNSASHLSRTRGLAPRELTGAILDFAGLKDGPYALEIWNTQNGSYETRSVDVKDGAIRIELPPLQSDLALKFRRN